MSDRRRRQQAGKVGMKKLLRSLAPTCTEVISGCRTGSKTILKGEDCCRHLLTKSEYRSNLNENCRNNLSLHFQFEDLFKALFHECLRLNYPRSTKAENYNV